MTSIKKLIEQSYKESLQDTDIIGNSRYSTWSNKAIAEVIRGAIQDELGAINLYAKIKDMAEQQLLVKERLDSEREVLSELIDAVDEIKKDEENHQGKLLKLVSLLDSDGQTEIEKGFKGEE